MALAMSNGPERTDRYSAVPTGWLSEVGATETEMLSGVRVVVISSEQPGTRMAGPAIRATELARQLQSAGAGVVLAVPHRPDADLGLSLWEFGKPDPRTFRRLAGSADIVVTQPQRVDVAAGLHRGDARVIYDCYVPSFVEYPASILADRGRGDRAAAKLIQRNQAEYAVAMECGDGFLVASERQKDFLTGALGQAGRLRHPPSAHDEAYPRIAVVPFGLPDELPDDPAEHRIKGSLVPPDSVVALWAGGIWNWFDPLTVIRGLRLARQVDPRLHLVFLAGGHPSAAFSGQNAATTALASDEVHELTESGAVVFADKWVPHALRWDYLRDADLGVCAHFDSPETRMSFRTRLLDHLWAGLPTVTTRGGVLSDVICDRGAGVGVPAEDPEAWGQTLLRLAGSPGQRTAMAEATRALAEEYTWPRVARPLVALVDAIQRGAVGPRRKPTLNRIAAYLLVAAENRFR